MDISLFGRRAQGDDDYYCDLSDDDDILCSSKYISSDEDDEKFFVVPTSTKIPPKVVSNKDDDDDFEREMASELSQTMKHLATSFSKNKPQSSTDGARSSQGSKPGDKEKELPEDSSDFYDDVYFDSDDSEPEAAETSNKTLKGKKKEKRRIMTNDELFYDPTLDDKDQEWVDKMRRSYQPKKKRSTSQIGTSSQPQKLPQSDAVLNCPACLTTLCMDCQRHEVYHNQYRAMFVFNCNVDMMETLTFPRRGQKKRDFYKNKKKNKGKQKMKQEGAQSSQAGSEMLQGETDGAQSSQAGSEMVQRETDGAQRSQAGSEMVQGEPDGAQSFKAGSEMVQGEPDGAQSSQAGSEMVQAEPDGAQSFQAGSEMVQGEPDGAQSSQAGSEMVQGEPDGAQSFQAGSEMVQGEPDGAQSSQAGSEIVKVEPDGTQSSQTSREMPHIKPANNTTSGVCQKSSAMDDEETCEDNNTSSSTRVPDIGAIKSSSLPKQVTFACSDDELFHPVTCKICNTKVAVYDRDEVYHFFNIVTSY